MQVRPDGTPDAAALPAALAVVAESGHDAAEWLGAASRRVRPAWFSNPASVRRTPGSSSHSSRTSPIMRVSPATVSNGNTPMPGRSAPWRSRYERPRSWYPPQTASTAAPSATDSAHAGGLREQVLRDERLFAILAAADVEEIVLARMDAALQSRRTAPRARGRATPRAATGPRCCRGPRRCSGSPGTDARRRSSRRPLPVRPDEPARAHDLPQSEHRRVRGEDDELAPGRCELEAAIERGFERGHDLDRALRPDRRT